MTRTMLSITEETCLAAVTAYVAALGRAGLEVRLEEAESAFELAGERCLSVAWGPEEDAPLPSGWPEEGNADGDADAATVAPCVLALYARTLRFLATHPRPAARWLKTLESPPARRPPSSQNSVASTLSRAAPSSL